MTFFEVNVSSILRTSVRNPVTTLISFVYVQAFCQAMVDKFSSIDMKSTSTKSVLELKGELRLICCDNDTWELWTRVFDLHSSGDLVNPDTEEKFNAVEGGECPPINREFFRIPSRPHGDGVAEVCETYHGYDGWPHNTVPENIFEAAKEQGGDVPHPGVDRSPEVEDSRNEGAQQAG